MMRMSGAPSAAMRSLAVLGLVGGHAGLTLACTAAPRGRPFPHPTAAQWQAARTTLATLRLEAPTSPYVAAVTTTLREPRSGRLVEARGAMAVAAGHALRMILVGGAGATVLDLWVTPDHWRIALPLLDVVRRGGRYAPAELPVQFLRWWFFAPFEGKLFAAAVVPPETTWLLRDGAAVVELRKGVCGTRERITATRRVRASFLHVESVDACRGGPLPSGGDSVRYFDEGTGLEVRLRVESSGETPPDSAAFTDPDVEVAEAAP